MAIQFLISNQTSTKLYIKDATRYAVLPPFSVNTAVLVTDATAMRISSSLTGTTGASLPVTSNYAYILTETSGAAPIYACVENQTTKISAVTVVPKVNFPYVGFVPVADSVVPPVGTTCVPAAGGAWTFDVTATTKTAGFVDAILITASGDPPPAADDDDSGWSWTTWALIIGGILLLLAVLGLIIFFATRKKTPTVAVTTASATDPLVL